MKTITLLLLAAFTSISAYAQKVKPKNVPIPVTSAFTTQFPAATEVVWEKTEATNEFEASFTRDKDKCSALFDKDGKWIETAIQIPVTELPGSVQGHLAKKFAKYKANEASKVSHAVHGNCFEVGVANDKESFELLYDENGNVISKKGTGGGDRNVIRTDRVDRRTN